MGNADAAMMSRESFIPPTTAWNAALATDTSTSMIAGCEFTGTNVDLSFRKYADNLAKTHICHDAQAAAYKVQHTDQYLSTAKSLGPIMQASGRNHVELAQNGAFLE
ncbi:unnamed protein product [Prorocentrum cordatum]|uniref:Uncharacterized protein n=1 Tax=Prorocentrum cordatum TaxID=2364126 RepID=A0ABN9WF75_9DINO|nr:unnamed protein product [Polarella glacialis]